MFRKCVLILIMLVTGLPAYTHDHFKRILFISSYNPSFPTFNHQIDGLRSVLDEEHVLLDMEFLDSKRFNTDEVIKLRREFFIYKFQHVPEYDLVITADDNALDLCMSMRNEFFNDVPIVFFGVNDIKKALSYNNDPMVTGLIEAVSMKDTIELMISLFPQTETITAISDATTSGAADLRAFNELQNQFPSYEFRTISLKDYTWQEFAAILSGLGRDTSLLLLSAYQDSEGNNLLFNESLKIIYENLKIPLFHLWYHGFGDGVFGGRVISHYEQAISAAETALKILDGASPASIPIRSDADNHYIFDYQELKRFGISLRKLPEDSEIINRPYSFLRENKALVLSSVSIFSIMAVLLLFSLININIRKKAESALRLSELKYRSLFYDNTSVIILFEPVTSRIIDLNQAAVDYLGYPENALKNLSLYNLLADEENIEEGFFKFDELSGKTMRIKLAKRDTRHIELFSGRLNAGSHEYLYAIIHDVTEKIKISEQIEHARIKAETALRVKNDFLANISHELRTPLNGVYGMLRLLAGVSFNTEEQEWYNLALVSTDNLKTIIEDLLNFTQFSIGKISISKQVFKLNNIGMLASEIFSDSLEKKDLHLSACKKYKSGFFYGDETRIAQIVNNLITNAIKYSENGKITCSIIESADELILEIADEGPGIKKEDLPLIFQPFQQLENIYTKIHRGMGLGLAIVKNIIDTLDGYIAVDSEPGQGTVFRIRIPGRFQP